MSPTSAALTSPTPRRGLLWALAAALALLAAWQSYVILNFQPPGLDFLPMWTAGRMAWTDPTRLYDAHTVTAAQAWLMPPMKFLRPFAYPPSALLILAPLGALPFAAALGLWLAIGVGAFISAGLRLVRGDPRLGFCLLLGAPAVVLAMLVGQSVLFAAGVAVHGALELERRPRVAGLLFAIAAAVKPQALLMAPVALIAAGAFETLAVAGIATLAIAAATAFLFGPARWGEWLAALPSFERVVETTPALRAGVITPAALARDLGLSGALATAWMAAFALAGAGLVWRAFAGPASLPQRLTALFGGGLLAAPYAMHYDASLLVPGAVAGALAARDDAALRQSLALVAVLAAAQAWWGPVAVIAAVLISLASLLGAPGDATREASA